MYSETASSFDQYDSRQGIFYNHFSAGYLRLCNFQNVYGIADNVKATCKVEVEVNDLDGNATNKEMTNNQNQNVAGYNRIPTGC